MCATTDLPKQQQAANLGGGNNDDEQEQQQQQHPTTATPPQKEDPSSRSSFLTPISINSRMDFTDDGDDVSNSSTTRVRLQRQRRPSLVLSDDGMETEQPEQQHPTDHHHVNFCAQMILLPAVCQGAGDQLDIFMACRHPLDLLGMSFPQDGEDGNDNDISQHDNNSCDDVPRLSGYHAIPTECEYCGSSHIDQCPEDCERPRTFFPKQRPPFRPKDTAEWDANDNAIVSNKTNKN
jgi:hypothetical protein